MKKVKLKGKVLTKKGIYEHICKVFFQIPLDKFMLHSYKECKNLLRFLILVYRPELESDYENLF